MSSGASAMGYSRVGNRRSSHDVAPPRRAHARGVKLRYLDRLMQSQWVKLIAGASFEDAPQIRNLAFIYASVGVDCIDVAANPSVVRATVEGIDAAMDTGSVHARPLLMVSVNDDESDPHFRKAQLTQAAMCPADCTQPCVRVCPADAISSERAVGATSVRVSEAQCYGCGRCFPACPHGLIEAASYRRTASDTAQLIRSHAVDALEIHTTGLDDGESIRQMWQDLGCHEHLKLLAVSLPETALPLIPRLNDILSANASPDMVRVWQLDGRPMTGDVGHGAARDAVSLARTAFDRNLIPAGHFVQLAGGTNDATRRYVEKHDGLISRLGGVAFGGYARKAVKDALGASSCERIEEDEAAMAEALQAAGNVVDSWRRRR
ncbi:iron-Sulfur binding protein [Pycnococcus provasolii]